ncbi:hypothetical protein BC628DRAFT_1378322 [Trametes gibbosa]|nr:hypothetical protein BC628DRAFT_1378322 [Trametes gibbosa]
MTPPSNSLSIADEVAQRSETTQNIPAPQGPRRPSVARYTPTRSLMAQGSNRTIPVDKFEEVIQDPGLYAQLYPEALPLTHRIHRQLRATQLIAAEAAAAANKYHHPVLPMEYAAARKIAPGGPCDAPPSTAEGRTVDTKIPFGGTPKPMVEAETYAVGGSTIHELFPCVVPPGSFPEASQAVVGYAQDQLEGVEAAEHEYEGWPVTQAAEHEYEGWPVTLDMAERGERVQFEPEETMEDQQIVGSLSRGAQGWHAPSDMLGKSAWK